MFVFLINLSHLPTSFIAKKANLQMSSEENENSPAGELVLQIPIKVHYRDT